MDFCSCNENCAWCLGEGSQPKDLAVYSLLIYSSVAENITGMLVIPGIFCCLRRQDYILNLWFELVDDEACILAKGADLHSGLLTNSFHLFACTVCFWRWRKPPDGSSLTVTYSQIKPVCNLTHESAWATATVHASLKTDNRRRGSITLDVVLGSTHL